MRGEKNTVLKKKGRMLMVTTSTARTEKTKLLKRATVSPVKKAKHSVKSGNTSKVKKARTRRGRKMSHGNVTNISTNSDPQKQQPRRKSLRIEEQTFQAAMSRLDDCDLMKLDRLTD